MAQKVREIAEADVGLSILGYMEKNGSAFEVKGLSAASGQGLEKTFTWEMGGDLITLQKRGAVIGLNTLRLALIEAVQEA